MGRKTHLRGADKGHWKNGVSGSQIPMPAHLKPWMMQGFRRSTLKLIELVIQGELPVLHGLWSCVLDDPENWTSDAQTINDYDIFVDREIVGLVSILETAPASDGGTVEAGASSHAYAHVQAWNVKTDAFTDFRFSINRVITIRLLHRTILC
jgi:hypothetical protein